MNILGTHDMPEMAKTFALDQLGRVPLYCLLIAALWYIHNENKSTQAHLVKVLETTVTSNTSAMDALRLELQIHRMADAKRTAEHKGKP